MATMTFHFRPSTRTGLHEGTLFIRIIHERKVKELTTSYRIFPHEWNEKGSCLVFPGRKSSRMKHLTEVEGKMQRDLKRLSALVKQFENWGKEFTPIDIADRFQAPQEHLLRNYAARLSVRMLESGHERAARAYRSAADSIIRFYGKDDLRLGQIDASLMHSYEAYLKDNYLSLNTISFYLRNLRAIYNKAVRGKLISAWQENPFLQLSTGIYPTQKCTLTKEEVQRIAQLASRPDLSPALQDTLFFFLFSYHASGMSFIDMAYLKKTDIREGTIRYIRKKTGKALTVKIIPPIQLIIRHFDPQTTNSPYLFPLIKPPGKERPQYERALQKQNRLLKILGKMAGIEKPLTTQVF
jgi:integrase